MEFHIISLPPSIHGSKEKMEKLFIHAFHKGITILCQSLGQAGKEGLKRHIGLCCQGAGGESNGKQATT